MVWGRPKRYTMFYQRNLKSVARWLRRVALSRSIWWIVGATRRNCNLGCVGEAARPRLISIAWRAKGCIRCGGRYSVCLTLEQVFDIAATFSHNHWRRWTSWASNTLGWWLCGRVSILPRGSHNRHHEFLHHSVSFIWPETSRSTGRGGGWNRISCIGYLWGVCTWRQVLELSCLCPVIGEWHVLQVGDDGVPPPQWGVET